MKNEVSILIGGEAGQGLVTVGQLLCKCLTRSGYDIDVYQSYMSRVRGGHNFFAIRAGTGIRKAPVGGVDILVALDEQTHRLHNHKVREGGLALFDEKIDPGGDACFSCVQVPFADLAPEPMFINVAAMGVLSALIGLRREMGEKVLRRLFGKKGEELVGRNVEVLARSYQWAVDQEFGFRKLPEAGQRGERVMLDGNQCIALGALAAGVDFCSFYPMSPSTSVALTLIEHAARMGVVVEQAEDEIAAVNMALGAACAGATALVPTSGGGFALMSEGVSLAGMTETPIVIALAQRPGPATGLPTRTGQGDLDLVLHAGHGAFPRAIFAPGGHEELFSLTHKAVGLAEAWQSPVFVLTDQYMADNLRAVEPFDLDALPASPGPLLSVEDPAGYRRYAMTESGVSPRLVPGFCEALVVVDSDEHTPDGHITEDLHVRRQMEDKRMRKMKGLVQEFVPPAFEGDEAPELLLVCWGTTRDAVLEAADVLREHGTTAGVLHFSQVWPLVPETFIDILQSGRTSVMIEGNTTGQLAGLLRRETGFAFDHLVLRYDGMPFTADYVLEALSGANIGGVSRRDVPLAARARET